MNPEAWALGCLKAGAGLSQLKCTQPAESNELGQTAVALADGPLFLSVFLLPVKIRIEKPCRWWLVVKLCRGVDEKKQSESTGITENWKAAKAAQPSPGSLLPCCWHCPERAFLPELRIFFNLFQNTVVYESFKCNFPPLSSSCPHHFDLNSFPLHFCVLWRFPIVFSALSRQLLQFFFVVVVPTHRT